MSLINLRHLPKNSFISLILPHIQTYHNDIDYISNKYLTMNNNTFCLNTKSTYNYTISELYKNIYFYTHIKTNINNYQYDIHEKIVLKHIKNNNYLNYTINIVDKNIPLIYSIKCIEQPVSFDLMKHYTEDIKKIYNTFE
jgi:hypothetical protein